jgi:hypothetical protein
VLGERGVRVGDRGESVGCEMRVLCCIGGVCFCVLCEECNVRIT